MIWDEEETSSSSEGEWRSCGGDPILEQEETAAVFVCPLDPSAVFNSEEDLEQHLQNTYGFTLQSLCSRRENKSSLEAFYNRCRIINYLRKHKQATLSDLLVTVTSDDAPFWTDNAYLIPVLPDDALLRLGGESVWKDDDESEGCAFTCPVIADPLPSKEHMQERGQQLSDQLQCLQELYCETL